MKMWIFFYTCGRISTYSKCLSQIHTIDFHCFMSVYAFGMCFADKEKKKINSKQKKQQKLHETHIHL